MKPVYYIMSTGLGEEYPSLLDLMNGTTKVTRTWQCTVPMALYKADFFEEICRLVN